MQKIIREMRGIPFFLICEYLEELGGKIMNEGLIIGPGWLVKLTRMEPFRIGSLSVGQNRIEIDIEDNLAEDFMDKFSKKTFRAGG